jgi:hypothetical protein
LATLWVQGPDFTSIFDIYLKNNHLFLKKKKKKRKKEKKIHGSLAWPGFSVPRATVAFENCS